MHLIQILLPLYDNDGHAFPADMYHRVRQELTETFDGLTAYNRAPAEGIWKSSSNSVARDDIVIFEIMCKALDKHWWSHYRMKLEKVFKQEHVVIRAQAIELL